MKRRVPTTVVSGVAVFAGALAGSWLADRYGRRGVILAAHSAHAHDMAAVPAALTAAECRHTLSRDDRIDGTHRGEQRSVADRDPRAPAVLDRATGLAIAYAVGVSLAGGSTQFVITWLLKVTGDPASPAWYVTVTSMITLAAMWVMPESRDRNIES